MPTIVRTVSVLLIIIFLSGCFFTDDDDNLEGTPPEESGLFSSGEIFFIPGMRFGSGFKKGSNLLVSQAACLNDFKIVKINERNKTKFKLTFIENAEHFKDLVYFRGKMSGVITTQAGPIRLTGETKLSNYIKNNRNSVFVMVEIEAELSDYAVEKPEMLVEKGDVYGTVSGTLRNLYGNDYERFSQKCGDVFLSTITTGGRYIGVIEIQTENQYRKNQVTLELSGKYIPLQLTVSGKLNVFIESLASKYRLNIHVLSRGIPSHEKIVDSLKSDHFDFDTEIGDSKEDDKIDENPGPDIDVSPLVKADIKLFLDDVDNFHNKIKQFANAPWHQAAYKAQFSSYASTAMEIEQSKGTPMSNNKENNIESYKNIYLKYRNILNKINDIKFSPQNYSKEESNEDVLVYDLYELEIKVQNSLMKLENYMLLCNGGHLCIQLDGNFESYKMIDPDKELDDLPLRKTLYPANCRELKESYNVVDGDKVILYLGGDETKPWNALCASPEEDPVNREISFWEMPLFQAEYLVLENRSAIESGYSMRHNFSSAEYDMRVATDDSDDESTDDPDEYNIERMNSIAAYHNLRVEVNPQHLSAARYQNMYFSQKVDEKMSSGKNAFSFFGTVRTCSEREIMLENSKKTLVGANCDLSGTPFVFSESTEYALFSESTELTFFNGKHEDECGDEDSCFAMSMDRKSLDIYLSSDAESCFVMEPYGDLVLEYKE